MTDAEYWIMAENSPDECGEWPVDTAEEALEQIAEMVAYHPEGDNPMERVLVSLIAVERHQDRFLLEVVL